MKKFLIICVDDERDVLDSVVRDLAPLEEHFIIEGAESVDEAQEVIEENIQNDIELALIICDHIMPEKTGIQFLIELNKNEMTAPARKLLLTGQAGLEDTIQAINAASLDFFIPKPWSGETLINTVVEQLTTYVIEQDPDLMRWTTTLNAQRILDAIANRRTEFGE